MKTSDFQAGQAYKGIHLFNESNDTLPVNQKTCKTIVALIEDGESCRFSLVEIVFVDEEKIISVNKEHLERSYITDIISFRYDEDSSNQAIEGTLYACAPRIRQQADDYGQTPATEFRRIIIHGLLHLAGYDDQSDDARQAMRQREDFYLNELS